MSSLDNSQPRRKLSLLQRLIRSYTFYTPIRRGRHRLALFAISTDGFLPGKQLWETADGRSLYIDHSSPSYQFVCYLGEYEPAITNIFEKIVAEGDICFDVGANIGWYSTLFQKLTGKSGQVHAFEPVPPMYEQLVENLNVHEPQNTVAKNLALGDSVKEIEMHMFDDLPDGHSSMSTFGKNNFTTFNCKMTTLNNYLEESGVGDVNIIKMDIEGAELMMLKGASRVFEQKYPPIWEIEMALATTKGFGYLPNDLLDYIRSKAAYEFYTIDEINGFIVPLKEFAPSEVGANVLCIPTGMYRERLARLKIRA